MKLTYNSNIKLLAGGSFSGGKDWTKPANELDKCYKIYSFRKGDARINGDNDKYALSAENLYFINGYRIDSQECHTEMVVDWIHFIPESVFLNQALKSSPCVVKLELNEFASFSDLFIFFDDLIDNSPNDQQHDILLLKTQSFIQFVIASVFKQYDARLFETETEFMRILPAIEYITKRYKTNICLNEIASRCNLSPNYFHRLFSATLKTSPFCYIRQLRMEEAIRQLIYTTKTVKEVSFDVGYEDEAFFSRTFSKLYKVSPGKYRKINRAKLP